MNDCASGPPSRSTSAVGARLPVSPNRLTSTRNVIASTKTSATSAGAHELLELRPRGGAERPPPLTARPSVSDWKTSTMSGARTRTLATPSLSSAAVVTACGEVPCATWTVSPTSLASTRTTPGSAAHAVGDGGERAVEAVDLDGTPGAREQLGGVALGDLPAGAEDDDAVAERLRLVELVRAHEHGLAVAPQPADVSPQRVPRLDVDAEGRLVEDQQLGVVQQRAPEREAPPQAARERAGPVPRGPRAPQLRHLRHAPVAVRHAEEVGREAEVLADGELVVERRLLRDDPDPAADRGRERRADRLAAPAHGAARRRLRPATGLITVVLPAPFGPRRPTMVPGRREREAVQRHAVAEAFVAASSSISAWGAIRSGSSRPPAWPDRQCAGISVQAARAGGPRVSRRSAIERGRRGTTSGAGHRARTAGDRGSQEPRRRRATAEAAPRSNRAAT